MLGHSQIHNVISQMPQKSDSAIFLQTQTINNNFFQEMGVGPEGPRKRKALAPIFGKNSIKKIVVHRLRL